MKKLNIIPTLVIFLLSACSGIATQPSSTGTPAPTLTKTPVPLTATATATATPLPSPISADNFHQIEEISTSALDQSKFVGFLESEKKDFYKVEANIPEGDVTKAYFISYQPLDNGEVMGLLQQIPLNCGMRTFGTETRKSCNFDRYYLSMINLSQNTTLWTQYMPINMAGEELNNLIAELGIKNFKPGFGPSGVNGGIPVNKWSADNLEIVIPIQVVNSTVIKDALNGKNILIHPWGRSPSWIGAVSPDKTKFAVISGGARGGMDTLIILNIADQTVESRLEVSNYVTDIAWSSDNSKIAVGKFNGSVELLDLTTKKVKYLIKRRFDLPDRKWGQGITRLKFSDDGMKIAFTENNYTIDEEKISRLVIYNLETMQVENSYSADFFQIGELIWSRDGSFVVTVTDFMDGHIVLLNKDGAVEYSLTAPDNVAEYRLTIFPSTIYFNEDQTQLTLIRSLFNEAVITKYEVKK